MGFYRNVIVGTDGSESSLRAVERAAQVAESSGATLYIATAFEDGGKSLGGNEKPRGENHRLTGQASEVLHIAAELARKAGVKHIEQRGIADKTPVDALLDLVLGVKADLLVVGNKGLASLTGRILGSVPFDVARKANIDVLIVHTV